MVPKLRRPCPGTSESQPRRSRGMVLSLGCDCCSRLGVGNHVVDRGYHKGHSLYVRCGKGGTSGPASGGSRACERRTGERRRTGRHGKKRINASHGWRWRLSSSLTLVIAFLVALAPATASAASGALSYDDMGILWGPARVETNVGSSTNYDGVVVVANAKTNAALVALGYDVLDSRLTHNVKQVLGSSSSGGNFYKFAQLFTSIGSGTNNYPNWTLGDDMFDFWGVHYGRDNIYWAQYTSTQRTSAIEDLEVILDGGTLGGNSGGGNSGSGGSGTGHVSGDSYVLEYTGNGTDTYGGSVSVTFDGVEISSKVEQGETWFMTAYEVRSENKWLWTVPTDDVSFVFEGGKLKGIKNNSGSSIIMKNTALNTTGSGSLTVTRYGNTYTHTVNAGNTYNLDNISYLFGNGIGTEGSGSGSGSGGGGTTEPGTDLPDLEWPDEDTNFNVDVDFDTSDIVKVLMQILADMRNLDRSTNDLVDLSGVIGAINSIEMPDPVDMGPTNQLLGDLLDEMEGLDHSDDDLVDLSSVEGGITSLISSLGTLRTDLLGALTSLSTTVSGVGTSVHTDLGTLNTSVSNVNGSIGTLRADVLNAITALSTTVSGVGTSVHTDLGTLNASIGTLDAHMRYDLAGVMGGFSNIYSWLTGSDGLAGWTYQVSGYWNRLLAGIDAIYGILGGYGINAIGDLDIRDGVYIARLYSNVASNQSGYGESMAFRLVNFSESYFTLGEGTHLEFTVSGNVFNLWRVPDSVEYVYEDGKLVGWTAPQPVNVSHVYGSVRLAEAVNGIATVNRMGVSFQNEELSAGQTKNMSDCTWWSGPVNIASGDSSEYLSDGATDVQTVMQHILFAIRNLEHEATTVDLSVIEEGLAVLVDDSSEYGNITTSSGFVPRILKGLQDTYTWLTGANGLRGWMDDVTADLEEIINNMGGGSWRDYDPTDPDVVLPDPGTDIVPVGPTDIELPHMDWEELAPVLNIPALQAAVDELMTKFPFVMLSKLLTIGGYIMRTPMAPVFDLPAPNPSDWSSPHMVHIDLSQFDVAASVLRVMIMIWAAARISTLTIKMWVGDKD